MSDQDDLARMRRSYHKARMDIPDVDADPIAQVSRWLAEAVAAGLREPDAMVLASVGNDGLPSIRTVLLRGIDARGFAFYTSYRSRKAAELAVNAQAALLFPWIDLERQVAVRGPVSRVAPAESDAYFASRPRGSQLGAWASEQSAVVADRAIFEQRLDDLRARFSGGPVPRPDDWGGFRVAPVEIELWQGRSDRMHDRLRYRRDGEGWALERLSP
ncbi:MAG: pyridoxamine 5'-phosphate oxidase [Actinomycetota bacterium]|nr:pyridoxamine 5'-phosphate oxidase [Actinomycetota bacterium]